MQRRSLLALGVALTLLVALMSSQRLTRALDWLWFDLVQQISALPPPDDLVIVEIDEKSLQSLGRWPWSREHHAELLYRLSEARAVVFDVIFADADTRNPAGDLAFARALSEHGRVILPLYLEQLGRQGQVMEVVPASRFYQAAAAIGHVHVAPDTDGVVRSLYLKEGLGNPYWPHLSYALHQLVSGSSEAPKGVRDRVVENSNDPHLIARDFHNWLPMPGSHQGIVHHSFVDVLEGRVTGFEGKIVFVGATAAGLGDLFTTSVGSMPGVELNAWSYQALSHELTIVRPAQTTVTWICAVAVLLLVVMLGHLSPAAFLLATLGSLAVILFANTILQLGFGIWLPVSPMVIALLLFYPLWSWLRLEVALAYLRRELRELSPVNLPATIAGTELVERTVHRLNQAQHQARKDRRLIEQSLENLQDAVIIADLNGKTLLINSAAKGLLAPVIKSDAEENLFEESGTEVEPGLLHWLATLEPANNRSWSELLRELLQKQEALSLQAKQEDRDLFVQAALISLENREPDTLIITVTDVSELKAAEKARMEALNFLSHDLRSPLVSVLAIVGMQRSDDPPSPEQALNDIELLVSKNLNYAESFLHLSRAQSLQPSQLRLCDLHAVLDAAQMQGMALARSKQIQLRCERTDEDAWVMGEQDMLERALLNLISNAVKYSMPLTEIELSLQRKGKQMLLQVSDQGKGIASEDLPTLFDRFTRSKKHQQEKGAGLGLHFVATVARRHQGRVTVESQPGKGSRFILALPACDESELDN
jgi:CHASE2 domain-containing sensor protein/signal transduction histidine kinase